MKQHYLKAIFAITLAAACLTACGDSSSQQDSGMVTEENSTIERVTEIPNEPGYEIAPGADIPETSTEEPSSAEESKEANSAEEEKPEEEQVLLKVEHFTPSGDLIYAQNLEYVKNNNGDILPLKATIEGNTELSKASIKESAYTYEYDDDFKHSKRYDKNGELDFEAFYDNNGKVTKLLIYESSRVNNTYLYEYDSEGRLSQETQYDGTETDYGRAVTTTYSYNNDGHVQKESFVAKDNSGDEIQTGEKAYEYDANGNNTKVTTTYSYGGGQIDTYTFDDHNNCTSKKVESLQDGQTTLQNSIRYEYEYNGDDYVKTSLSKYWNNDDYGEDFYFTASKETYSGGKIQLKEIYSAEDAAHGNFDVLAETVKYTYGNV